MQYKKSALICAPLLEAVGPLPDVSRQADVQSVEQVTGYDHSRHCLSSFWGGIFGLPLLLRKSDRSLLLLLLPDDRSLQVLTQLAVSLLYSPQRLTDVLPPGDHSPQDEHRFLVFS